VLVVVVAVGRMAVAVVSVVEVPAVLDGFVAALRAVLVVMARVSQVRQRMLVIMALVRRMSMPVVHVVDVTFALDARVPAAWPVAMVVMRVAWMRISW